MIPFCRAGRRFRGRGRRGWDGGGVWGGDEDARSPFCAVACVVYGMDGDIVAADGGENAVCEDAVPGDGVGEFSGIRRPAAFDFFPAVLRVADFVADGEEFAAGVGDGEFAVFPDVPPCGDLDARGGGVGFEGEDFRKTAQSRHVGGAELETVAAIADGQRGGVGCPIAVV